ncbi:hypothetical protein HYALB_00003671 [Hymenoscyphus albidus]|uniref:Cytochrome P450 n=1 Tax=Hymenoscyphus albidus TaxID=595503 RepID=A0A9N9LHL0_9HELO|nr:hypothetical protein HYALB_00003671 [Hymenoscyphus albidus]
MPHFYAFMRKVGIDLLPRQYRESKGFLEQWMSNMTSKADRATDQKRRMDVPLKLAAEPVIYEATKAAVEADSPHLSEEARKKVVASEMFNHISASREVLGLVLGYTFWYLAQHPHAQKCIWAELEEYDIDMTNPEQLDVADPASRSRPIELDSLPYIRAVVDESLRMRPISILLPRITPSDRTVSVAGVDNIPPVTRINAFQWFVHRDPNRWENAQEWQPERWLGRRETDKKSSREDVLWTFPSGPRMCLGNNWTYYGMLLGEDHMCFYVETR